MSGHPSGIAGVPRTSLLEWRAFARLLLARSRSPSTVAPAAAARICVCDPAGKSGHDYAILEERSVRSSDWGAEVDRAG